MADLTKEQLRQQNNTLFADNNSGNISAQDLRTFNNEIIDAVALDVNPSFTGSVLVQGDVSASTYYGDGSNLTGVTSEVPSGTISGSSQVDYPLISNIPSGIVSSSAQISDITGSSLVTASFASQTLTFTKGDGSTFGIVIPDESGSILPPGVVSGSSQVVLEDTTFTDGIQFQVLRTDGAGNLSFDFADRTQIEVRASEAIDKGDPLYVVGFNVGQNRVEVGKADASDPSKMPVYGLAYESVSQNTNTQMVSIGTLDDIDTQVTYDFQVGDIVYVAAGGGLTNVKPTGTNLIQNVGIVGRRNQNNGEIVVSAIGRSNDVPNIQQGYAWVGNASGVATPTSTASWDAHSDLTSLNAFTQSQEELNVTFATTGSNTFIGAQDIQSTLDVAGGTILSVNGSTIIPLTVENGNGTKLTVFSEDDETATGVAVQVNGNGEVNGEWFANSLQSEPGDADTPPLFVTDAVEPRVIVNSQNGAIGDGWNIQLNGDIDVPSGNISLSGTGQVINNPSGAVVAASVEGQTEMATPLLLIDSIEPNTGTDITLNATNFVVSSSIQMAPNTAVVGPLFEATSEVATPTLLVDTIEGNSDTEIDLIGRLKLSTAGDGDARLEVNFDAGTKSQLYGTTLEFFANGAQAAKYTQQGPLSRITTAASLNPDGGMVLTGNSRAWSGLGIEPAVASKAGAGIFYATGSTSETLPLVSIKPSNTYDNKVYIGNNVDSLVLTGSVVEVSGTMVGPVFEVTSEVATPLLLVDSLEPNLGDTITITTDKLNTNISGATSGPNKPYQVTYTNPANASQLNVITVGQAFSDANKSELTLDATNMFFGSNVENFSVGNESITQGISFGVSGSSGGAWNFVAQRGSGLGAGIEHNVFTSMNAEFKLNPQNPLPATAEAGQMAFSSSNELYVWTTEWKQVSLV